MEKAQATMKEPPYDSPMSFYLAAHEKVKDDVGVNAAFQRWHAQASTQRELEKLASRQKLAFQGIVPPSEDQIRVLTEMGEKPGSAACAARARTPHRHA
jgi:hypothetical protein